MIRRNKFNEKLLEGAEDYKEWLMQARAYDTENGLESWQKTDRSKKYDYVLIQNTMRKLRHERLKKSNKNLLFILNEGVHGNFGNIGNEELYTTARSGTKKLIISYIHELDECIRYIASDEVADIDRKTKLDFLLRAEECYGHSALLLSGSGSLLYFHIGVVLALHEAKLLPKVISGSSGGAFIGSMLCTHEESELAQIFSLNHFLDQELYAEVRSPDSAQRPRSKSTSKNAIPTPDDFYRSVERLIPDMTFSEACEQTGLHLNISIASAESAKTSRLLNAKTAPNVFIRDAVKASAAAPGLFAPHTLAARNGRGDRQPYLPDKQWVDGSLSSDLPMKKLSRLYGVNHFIVSQANPHIIPFVTGTKRQKDTLSLLKYASLDTARTWFNTTIQLWQKPPFERSKAARFSNRLLSVINQDYLGDINILPPRQYFNPLKGFSQLSYTEMANLIDQGRRATWPKIEMIREQTRISRTLNSLLKNYRDNTSFA